MINIRYHSELIEQAVRHAARQDLAVEHELHHDIDPIYETSAGEDRDDRFTRTFARWFARFRLDQFVDEALSHFPLIVHHVRDGVVRAAQQRKSEGAELFVRDDAPAHSGTLVVQMCPESLSNAEASRDGFLRELQHVEDMLDPAFGYERTAIDGLPMRQHVTLERYRLLWAIRVEQILTDHELIARSQASRLRMQFHRAFVGGPPSTQDVFDRLWDQGVGSHSNLLEWSKDPRALFGSADTVEGPCAPGNGQPCPVCGFPTFDWHVPSKSDDARIGSRVREAAPDWDSSAGICRQCAETLLSGVPMG